MIEVLSKVLVARFYKMNAGFFLFIFIALFALLPGPDTIKLHHSLMVSAMSSIYGFVTASIIFAIGNLKCISFCTKEFDKPENSFLYNLQALANPQQFVAFFACHVSIYFPFLAYGLFMVVTGISEHHVLAAIMMLLYQMLMCVSGAYLYMRCINGTWQGPAIKIPSIKLFKRQAFSLVLLYYSLYDKKAAFIGIKLFSLLALQFLVILNADRVSKENVCFLILMSISAHALLPVYYVQFMEEEMTFLRNLPMGLIKRYGVYILAYSVAFLPELIFLMWNERNVLPTQLVLSLYVLAIIRLSFFTSLQYLRGMTVDRYTGVVFVMFFVTLILLASLPLWIFIVAESIAAVAIYCIGYYKYENFIKLN